MPPVGYHVRPGRGEVLGGARVVHRERAPRWRDHRLKALKRCGYLEVRAVQVGDRSLLQVLHPLPELFHPFDGPFGVGIEHDLRRLHPLARRDLLCRRFHLCADTVDLVPAPGICLAQVQFAAVVGTRVAGVPLLADGVVLGRARQVLLPQEAAEGAVALGRGAGGVVEVASQPPGEPIAGAPHELIEEAATPVAGPRLALLQAGLHLPLGRRSTRFETGFERRAIARERLWQTRQPPGDGRPVGFALGGHQVERAADALHRRGQHVHAREVVARLVQLRVDGECFAHHLAQDAVAFGFEGRRLQVRERVPREPVAQLEALDRVVRQFVLVPGDTEVGGGDGIERGQRFDVRVSKVGDC